MRADEVLKQLLAAYPYQLKFAVRDRKDMPEVNTIVKETGADRDRVLLMPEGTDPGVLYERAQWIAEACKEFHYRYCPRVHIDIWGMREASSTSSK